MDTYTVKATKTAETTEGLVVTEATYTVKAASVNGANKAALSRALRELRLDYPDVSIEVEVSETWRDTEASFDARGVDKFPAWVERAGPWS